MLTQDALLLNMNYEHEFRWWMTQEKHCKTLFLQLLCNTFADTAMYQVVKY